MSALNNKSHTQLSAHDKMYIDDLPTSDINTKEFFKTKVDLYLNNSYVLFNFNTYSISRDFLVQDVSKKAHFQMILIMMRDILPKEVLFVLFFYYNLTDLYSTSQVTDFVLKTVISYLPNINQNCIRCGLYCLNLKHHIWRECLDAYSELIRHDKQLEGHCLTKLERNRIFKTHMFLNRLLNLTKTTEVLSPSDVKYRLEILDQFYKSFNIFNDQFQNKTISESIKLCMDKVAYFMYNKPSIFDSYKKIALEAIFRACDELIYFVYCM
jgi:hypothetical protein